VRGCGSFRDRVFAIVITLLSFVALVMINVPRSFHHKTLLLASVRTRRASFGPNIGARRGEPLSKTTSPREARREFDRRQVLVGLIVSSTRGLLYPFWCMASPSACECRSDAYDVRTPEAQRGRMFSR